MTKRFVRDHLIYVHVVTDDGASALQVKREIQRQGLAGKLPRLNPKRIAAPTPSITAARGRRP